MHVRFLVLGALCLSCAGLERIPENTCGNGVVDTATEDCDTFPDACGTTGASACRLVCDASTPCPAGWGCGTEGFCRQPTGEFLPASSPLSAGASALVTGDFDGDGRVDIIGTPAFGSGASARAHFFDGDGNLETTTPLQVSGRLPVVRDFDGDGLSDLGFAITGVDIGAFGALSGRRDRTFATVLYPALTLADTSARSVAINASKRISIPSGQQAAVVVATTTSSGNFLRSYVSDALNGEETLNAPFPLAISQFVGAPAAGLVVDPGADATCGQLVVAYNAGTEGRVVVASPCARAQSGGVRWANQVRAVEIAVPGLIAEPGAIVLDAGGDGFDDVFVRTTAGTVYQVPGGPEASLSAVALPTFRELPLAAGDLDGDGVVDLVFPSGVLFTGATGPAARPRDGQRWAEAVVGRFNGDELPDVLIRYADSLDVEVLGNSGDGRFASFVVRSDQPVRRLASGDFDGDRIQDVAFLQSPRTFDDPAGSGEVELVLAYGKSAGGPETPRIAGRFAAARNVLRLRNVDVALDDLAVVETTPSTPLPTTSISVLFGSGERQAVAPLFLRDDAALVPYDGRVPGSRGRFRFWQPVALAAGSFRAPGTTDVFAVASGVTVDLSQQGPGALVTPFPTGAWMAPDDPAAPGGLGAFTQVVALDRMIDAVNLSAIEEGVNEVTVVTAAADIDVPPDGIDEVVALSRSQAGTTELRVVRSGTKFGAPIALPDVAITGGDPVELVDLDADGRLDLVAIARASSGSRVLFALMNDGAGSFVPAPIVLALPALPEASEEPLAFARVTTGTRPDGRLWTRLGVVTESRLFLVSLGAVASGFEVQDLSARLGTTTGRMTAIASGDFDGDGVADLCVADSGALRILRQQPRLR